VDDEIFPPECQAEGAFLTPVGQAAFPDLVNSDIDISAGPCHSHFEGDLGDLDIIAMDGTTFVSVAGTGSTVSEVEPSESPLEATFISIGDDVAGSLVKPELIGTGLSVTESQPNESALTATSFALGDDIQGTLIKPVIPGTGNLVPESEPNDSLATATPVNIGDDFSGSLLEPVTDPDTDYFRFSASGGEKLAFTIDFGSDVVFLEFEILASDGTVLNHLCCNLGRLHESIFTLPQTAGTYYIRLHYRAGSGSYVFGLRESDAEDPFYDYDYFSFQASGGEKLAFTIEYANLLFHEFAIIAPDGTTKLQSLCCNLGSPHESSFTLPDVAGTYYLMLRQSAGEGAYTLKVRTTELEHPFLDYDYFAFDAAGGEKLVFRIEYPTALLFHEFAILAPDGITKLESVCCNLGDPYEAIFTLPDITGTYYLLLRQTGTTSDYLVKVRATESAGPFPFIIGGEAVSIVPTPPPSIDLSPDVAFNPVGTSHTLIASVTDGFGAGPEGQQVIFDVIAGPNAGLGDTAVTDASGNATFSYVGAGGIGLDQIQASFFDVHGTEIQSDVVLKSWDDCTIGPISELSPVEGSKFVAGTTLVISGRLLDRGGADTSISTVQINGVPVDTIDASGRFFYVSQIPLGVTTFDITVSDACGKDAAILNLVGESAALDSTDSLSDISALLSDEYQGTTFNRANEWLVVDAKARNIGENAIRGSVLMAVRSDLDPAVDVVNRAGFTAQDEPFFEMVQDEVLLDPSTVGTSVGLRFANPQRVPVHYGVRWLARGNQAPYFTTLPILSAVSGETYVYTPFAFDPDDDALSFLLQAAPMGMTIAETSGQLSWVPQADQKGLHYVSISMSDGNGGTGSQSFTISVDPEKLNQPPVFTTAPVTQVDIGQQYSYDADAVDFDGDPITYSIGQGPAGLIVDTTTGLLEWLSPAAGQYPITLRAEDGFGGSVEQGYVLAVGSVPANGSVPLISGSPKPYAVVGETYLYKPTAIDADGDPLTFELTIGPAEMSIDPATGLLQWVPDATQMGLFDVTITVSDGRGGTASQSFAILVTEEGLKPPFFDSGPAPAYAIVDTAYQHIVHATDPDGGEVSYSLVLAPQGMTLAPDTGDLGWIPTTADIGSHNVVIEAADASGETARFGYWLTVKAANTGPSINSSPGTSVTAGNTYHYDVDASDPDGDALTYGLVQGPSGMTIDPLTGLVSWTTGIADAGSNEVAVVVSDCCVSATQSFTIDAAPDVTPPSAEILRQRNCRFRVTPNRLYRSFSIHLEVVHLFPTRQVFARSQQLSETSLGTNR
jgi:hypothetical protein